MKLSDFLLTRYAEMERHERMLLQLAERRPDAVFHDPLRRLAELDALRRIVEWEAPFVENEDMTLRFLAVPYSDHDDYREEWRPPSVEAGGRCPRHALTYCEPCGWSHRKASAVFY